MSTRWCVAKPEADGWRGRYVHNSGSPDEAGVELLRQYEEVYHGDVSAMIKTLVDDAPRGWSWVAEVSCKSDDGEGFWIESSDTDVGGTEYVYVLTERGVAVWIGDSGAFGCGGGNFQFATVVPWGDAEGMLHHSVSCGENYERCRHYAWVHFPEAEEWPYDRLTTAEWLGHKDITADWKNAREVIFYGQHYRLTGSGGVERSTVWDREAHCTVIKYGKKWLASATRYGTDPSHRIEIPLVVINKTRPWKACKGVELIFPELPSARVEKLERV